MIWFFMLCYHIGLSLSVEVEVSQYPSELIIKPKDKVQIKCSHDKTDFRVMLWYQRSPGDSALKLIGYLNYGTFTPEDKYKDQFNVTGDLSGGGKKTSTLVFKDTGPEQAAVYFCAASKAR
ncbi:hypothetical protein L3Q82_008116 [Xyrichtys novacula]|uniref:Ig-like domain-containing protein n=1 Tax=Xyrichtys novacula TaxID=13765 RepID=A0AAV1GMI0_XYRNO|nr:hypothetical protein L3Q82_008116 [Xyrichtys novacula]